MEIARLGNIPSAMEGVLCDLSEMGRRVAIFRERFRRKHSFHGNSLLVGNFCVTVLLSHLFSRLEALSIWKTVERLSGPSVASLNDASILSDFYSTFSLTDGTGELFLNLF